MRMPISHRSFNHACNFHQHRRELRRPLPQHQLGSRKPARCPKLSSGSRITSASDDAAGLAISTRISSDITTLQQAATNASQATSILQTADGGASNISDILARMKSLASESASGTVSDVQPRLHQLGIHAAHGAKSIRIATGTRYSSQSLLDGSSAFASRRLGAGRLDRVRHHHDHADQPDRHPRSP